MRVAGVYAVAAWAAVEVSATVFPLLGLPEWTTKLVVVLALLGFPVAFVLAWVFDLTPGGVRRTLPVENLPVDAPAVVHVPRTTSSRAAGFFGLGILVALIGFAAYARFGPVSSISPPRRAAAAIESIAVLPFVDFSEARDQEYFSDGVTEELLNRLVHIEGLRVAARTSSFAFKGRNEDVTDIGRKLRVQAVLEGSVRREGNRLRVTAQLIDVSTGYHLWSETYEREQESIFAIQDEIASAIVDALQKQFTPEVVAAEAGTKNVRAHEFYLRGLARWHDRTYASLTEAIGYFERAIAEDPDYALAHAGLAQAYAVLPAVGPFPFGEAVALGTAAAARALAIDASLAQAHAAIGQIAQNFEWELGDAERAYWRALEFEPSYATAHQWYAETLILLGRLGEAEHAINRALELDPISPAALNVRGYRQLIAGDVSGALASYRALAALHPAYALGQLNLALTALVAREYEVALTAISHAALGATQAEALSTIVRGLANDSLHSAAVEAVSRLEGSMPEALVALWDAALSEHERALQRLERSFAEHNDANFPMILVHPLLEPLRETARFQTIARGVGIHIR